MAARSLLAYNPVKIYIVLESLWTPSTLQMESTWTIAGVWTLYVESTWSPSGVQILYLEFTWSPDTVSGVYLDS